MVWQLSYGNANLLKTVVYKTPFVITKTILMDYLNWKFVEPSGSDVCIVQAKKANDLNTVVHGGKVKWSGVIAIPFIQI